MKKTLIFLTFVQFFNFSYSQITMGKVEKEKENIIIVKAPPYNNLENLFILS